MIQQTRAWILLCAAGLPPVAAHGHHSWGAVYDGGEEITLQATIVSEPFRNPHNAVHVQVENDAGELEPWTVEWRGQRRRDGEPPVEYDLNPGDAVVIEGQIARDASTRKIQMHTLVRPADGMTIDGRRRRDGRQ